MDITKEMEIDIMAGTLKGGLKAKQTNYKRQGPDFYRRIGRIGGATKTDKPKGFAADKARAVRAGAIGGRISKRGPKNVEAK